MIAKSSIAVFRLTLALTLVLSGLFAAGSASRVAAQEGASSASASRSRYLAEAGMIPAAREVAVEEFVNYYRHRLPLPKAGESVAVDVRWGGEALHVSRPEAVLQIGFTTPAENDRTDLRPLNLALVIDKSGSMRAEDKLTRVKQSLLTMLDGLRPADVVSLVAFDSSAQVLVPAQPLGDKRAVRETIRGLQPGSSTNIHAGLMLGYKEAAKSFRAGHTNRVILLTDGIANTGVTDPAQIAKDSFEYNDRGIDLSTIGVGLELDKDLLRKLAKSGRGLFHFVADSADIQKVFVNELQSLVSPVARDVTLAVDYDPNLKLAQLYGYDPELRRGGLTLKLDDMNNGLTAVVLMRFGLRDERTRAERLPVRVRLSYFDIRRNRRVTETRETSIAVRRGGAPGDVLEDAEVRKNFTVAVLGQAVRDMAAAWEGGNYAQAEAVVNNALAAALARYPRAEDADILYTLNIVKRYQEIVARHNRQAVRGDDVRPRR